MSVDPLVTKTMQPYIYGAANPVTYSDPTGLDPDTSSEVREKAEARGDCTYSSAVEKCYQKPNPNFQSTTMVPLVAKTTDQEFVVDYGNPAVKYGFGAVNPHRQASIRNGTKYVGGYRDLNCDFACAMETIRRSTASSSGFELVEPTSGTAWGTKAAGATNVAWGGYKIYKGVVVTQTVTLILGPVAGVTAGSVHAMPGALRVGRGGSQLFDDTPCHRCSTGDHLTDYAEGIAPVWAGDWIFPF